MPSALDALSCIALDELYVPVARGPDLLRTMQQQTALRSLHVKQLVNADEHALR